jgi:hypothetical protein
VEHETAVEAHEQVLAARADVDDRATVQAVLEAARTRARVRREDLVRLLSFEHGRETAGQPVDRVALRHHQGYG